MDENKNKKLSYLHHAIRLVSELSVDKSSQILSKMLKTGCTIEVCRIEFFDIATLSKEIFKTDAEVVTSSVALIGDAPFIFLFCVDYKDSLTLTDLFSKQPVGTEKDYGIRVQSTVQEIGNVLSSCICNIFARDFKIAMRPEPPRVVRDFSAPIFYEFISSAGKQEDDVMLIETIFFVINQQIKCSMYAVARANSIEVLKKILSS